MHVNGAAAQWLLTGFVCCVHAAGVRVCDVACRFATPMRTPRSTIAGQDSLMQQAANLAKMRDMQTPLLGGENPDLAGGWVGVVA